MGNHEYCTGCGASDFHSGQSCEEAYPEGFKRKQAEKIIEEKTSINGTLAAKRLIALLKKEGWPAQVQWAGGHVQVYTFDLCDKNGEIIDERLKRASDSRRTASGAIRSGS